ncbi:MAG: GGDEF domain-containing protein [Deltaproteobacteria bacterium]|nr:GGDEF domain-containing protein [Deltaproteobacteria bacterium]
MNKEAYILNIDEKVFFKDLVSLCPDGIIAINRKGMIVIFNKAAEVITGYTAEETLGKISITELYHSAEMARRIKKDMYGKDWGGPGRLHDYEVEAIRKSGEKIPIRFSATLLWDNGEEVGSVGFFADLTPHKRMEEKFHQMSITDGLTGLYNHRHFYTVLSEELNRAKRYKRPLSLMCFDLDNLKHCNDNYGHLEGDRVLRLVGDTLRSVLRQSDSCFRYGGDEFMVLLPEANRHKAFLVAEKVRDTFALRSSHSEKGKDPQKYSFSIGIAQASKGEDTESFIKRADLAMYEAKKEGGDQIRIARRNIGKKIAAK